MINVIQFFNNSVSHFLIIMIKVIWLKNIHEQSHNWLKIE